MQKKWIVIVLTVLLFLSAALIGVTSVYRIDGVTVVASVVTDAAKDEAVELERRLNASYENQISFFADETEAEEILADFSHFRMTSFEKSYPDKIIVKVTEDAEVYAVACADKENSYYILGGDGTILGIRDSYVNRLDGAQNVLLEGLTASGEKGAKLSGDDCFTTMLQVCDFATKTGIELRRNVISVAVVIRSPETIFRVTMREGVCLYIGDPTTMTEEKTIAAMNKYLSLSDEEKLCGRITVTDNEGTLVVTYSKTDEFSK